jgi:hypothetical protein
MSRERSAQARSFVAVPTVACISVLEFGVEIDLEKIADREDPSKDVREFQTHVLTKLYESNTRITRQVKVCVFCFEDFFDKSASSVQDTAFSIVLSIHPFEAGAPVCD